MHVERSPRWLMTSTLAAVNVQYLASNKVGRLEVKDCIDDIGDRAHMAHRMQGVELCMRRWMMHRRLYDTERNRVDPNPALGVFNRKRLGRTVQAALGQRSQN